MSEHVHEWHGSPFSTKFACYYCDALLDLGQVGAILNEHTKLEAENKGLREYATHMPGCYENSDECICGLDTLLAEESE